MDKEIKLVTFFGKAVKNVEVNIIEPENLFLNKIVKAISKILKENEKKSFNLNLKEGIYLIQVIKNKRVFEKVVDLSKINNVNLILPLFFGFFKSYKLSNKEFSELVSLTRWDLKKCCKCKKKYESIIDRYKCKYCKEYFCLAHQLPERHNCKGNPQTPLEMRQHFEVSCVSKVSVQND